MRVAFRFSSIIAFLLLSVLSAFAQKHEYATWTVSPASISASPGGNALFSVAGRVESGWHLYSASTAGGIPTSFQVGPETIVERVRLLQPAPKRAFDKNFGLETETFEGEVTFLLELQIKKDAPPGAQELS